jgi:tetratricopeptide (TPR) repeat protein
VLYVWAGQRERGRELFTDLAAHDFADLPREMLWMTTLCTCAEACIEFGDARRAAIIYELLVPYKDRNVQSGSAWCGGPCERFVGLCAHAQGDYDTAIAHLERALVRAEAWGLRNVPPLIRADLARARLARGDREAARAYYEALLPEAEGLGMTALVREAHEALLDPIEHG